MSTEANLPSDVRNVCRVVSCGRPISAKCLCVGHYKRLYRDGDVREDYPLKQDLPKVCPVPGCGRKSWRAGYCQPHGERLEKRGSLMADKPIGARNFGADNPHWKGGITVSRGYEYVLAREHPLSNAHGRIAVHRLEAERKLGRLLKPTEVVHHINGKRNDNRAENLQVLNSISEHKRLHDSACGGWARNHPQCVSCGTTSIRHDGQGRCCKCWHAYRRSDQYKRVYK